jgi:hypothetical protein
MSPFWNISKAIRATEGDALHMLLHKEWMKEVNETDDEGYYAFQHWVQIRYPAVYKKALAYARVMGLV